jgi:hypothetical protein
MFSGDFLSLPLIIPNMETKLFLLKEMYAKNLIKILLQLNVVIMKTAEL